MPPLPGPRTCALDECGIVFQPRRDYENCCSEKHGKLYWKQVNGPTTYPQTCVTCSKGFRSSRRDGKYCSDECKGLAYGDGRVIPLPRDHPVKVLLREREETARIQLRVSRIHIRDCEWCGDRFCTTRDRQHFCQPGCNRRAKLARRKSRQYGWTSHYTWAEVMRVFLLFDRCCAYCEELVEGQPDPDHVVPLSRGGPNSITNILPCCRRCNGDKRDLLLDEWAIDRKQRGKSSVTTSWAIDDPRVQHLALFSATA